MGNRVVAAPRDPNKVRTVMRGVVPLRLLRGSFCTVANDAAVMEAGVWGKLPEDILLWEVLRYVPAAKLFHWQLVSRKWRRELTSPLFRKGVLTESWAVKQQQLQEEEEGVVACVYGRSSSHVRVVNVDVTSMVPSWFWDDSADDWPYACFIVVAAAHGLMCISNHNKSRSRYCVLNPLTRTCVVLPELPFEAKEWHLPNSAAGAAGAVTILGWSGTAWDLATYGLVPPAAAGGGGRRRWVVAHMAAHVPNWAPTDQTKPPVYAQLGVGSYWYNCVTDKVHVLASRPGGLRGRVEVAAQYGPSTGTGFMRCYHRAPVLVAHRGAIFFVSQVSTRTGQEWTWGCGVWRLVRKGRHMMWENVARLDVAELEQLTGVAVSHVAHGDGVDLLDSYGVRGLVCCHVMAHVSGSAGSSVRREWVPAFNLDTGKWELLLNNHHHLIGAGAMELRPDLFLS